MVAKAIKSTKHPAVTAEPEGDDDPAGKIHYKANILWKPRIDRSPCASIIAVATIV